MKNFTSIIFLLLALQVEAQISNQGRFSVGEKSGCAPFDVTVTANDCDGSISCTLIWGNGDPNEGIPNRTKSNTYDNAGSFFLIIIFGGSGSDTLEITTFPNIQPAFETYICASNQVSVKITDTNYDQYIINYDDGATATVPKGLLAKDVHTFAASGNRTVRVRGRNSNSADNCFPEAIQTINVTQNLEAAVISQLEVLSATQIKLDYNNPPVSNQLNTQYRLEIATNNSTTFQQLQTIYNTTTTTVANLRPDENFYCFRMAPFDVCANSIVSAAYSDIICSANFDLDIQSDVNKLTWTTYSPGSDVTDFSIAKNPGTPIAKLPSDAFHDDIDITCTTDYCYKLTTNYTNGSRSISLEKCGKAFSNVIPTPIEDISSIVSETGVALTWIQDPAFTSTDYSIHKSTNGLFGLVANTTTTTYADPTYLTESNSCYKISYIDACLNASPLTLSAEACPIRLSGSLLANNNISLSWSDYAGWKSGVNRYEIQKFNSQGQLIETIPNGSATIYTDATPDFANQTYVYVITAFANDAGVSESVSNAIRIIKEPYLTYPTAFSPRGNVPENQLFKVFGQYVSSFELRIFNRWGQEMFYTSDFDIGWDGTYNGSLMPEGTYVFTAKIVDQEGRTFDRSGTVVLLVKR